METTNAQFFCAFSIGTLYSHKLQKEKIIPLMVRNKLVENIDQNPSPAKRYQNHRCSIFRPHTGLFGRISPSPFLSTEYSSFRQHSKMGKRLRNRILLISLVPVSGTSTQYTQVYFPSTSSRSRLPPSRQSLGTDSHTSLFTEPVLSHVRPL